MQGRRTTKAFEDDPELEFEFMLADRLKMTVGYLRQHMSNYEFRQWATFLAREAQQRELASKRERQSA